jgi:hypothetical protein
MHRLPAEQDWNVDGARILAWRTPAGRSLLLTYGGA